MARPERAFTPIEALYAWALFLVAGAIVGFLSFLTVYLYVASTGAVAFDNVHPLKSFVAAGAVVGVVVGAAQVVRTSLHRR